MRTVSTLALATTMVFSAATSSTAAPAWTAPCGRVAGEAHSDGTSGQLIRPPVSASEALLEAKQSLYRELITYLPGHPEGDPGIISSETDVVTAFKIIRAIPQEFALPTLMRTDEGEIGMYWDDKDLYVDINIEPDGTFSLFSRRRSTKEEIFTDSIETLELTHAWFAHVFSYVDQGVAA